VTSSAPPPPIVQATAEGSITLGGPPPESRYLELSGSVLAARTAVGADPVPVTVFIRAILSIHVDEGHAWGAAIADWPDPDLRQPAEQWIKEIHSLVQGGGTLFMRLAATALCLLDPEVARAAERSGVLWDVARGIRPEPADFLSPAGLRLLRRRAPLTAFGLGLLDPALELKGRPGEGAATILALSRQERAAAGQIAEWAAVYAPGLYLGRGAASNRVRDEAAVAAMGWSRRGRLHVVRSGPGGAGLVRVDPRSDAQDADAAWPTARRAHVGEGFVAVVQDDGTQVHWGVTDGGGPEALPLRGISAGLADVAAADLHVAVVDDGGRLWTSDQDRAWQSRGDVPPGAVLAASADRVGLGGPDGVILLLPWNARDGVTLEIRALEREAVELLTTGGDLTVVAGDREVAVLAGDALVARRRLPDHVAAVAASPDAAAVAVALANGDLLMWRVDVRPDLRLTSYTPDAPEGTDLLGIDPVVDALTALVAARAVEPPLSVGLFGAWGSGKSFFMRRLQAGVDEVCTQARASGRAQESLWAWRNIRQVRFNAWHYASADVWAGMVEQLVRGLSEPSRERLDLPEGLERLQRQRIEQLTGARAADLQAGLSIVTAQEQLRAAQTAVADSRLVERRAAAAVASARVDAATAVAKHDVEAGVADAAAAVGVGELVTSLEQLTTQYANARRSAGSLRQLFRPGERWPLIRALLAGPVVALLAGVIVWLIEPTLTDTAATIAWLAGTAAALASWLNRATTWIEDRISKIDEAEAEARSAWAAAHKDLQEAELAAALAAEDVAAAEVEAQRAAAQLEQAELAATAGPGALLVEYLAGRNTSDDYRSQLGLIGTVRADLEVISDAVVQHNRGLPDDDVVNRVVLYVDDLDRCPPAVVVKVLEAVHLLLSYPLFVVVVAVDPHWVSKSLATVYPTLLTGSDVTPDHYLEKIFQLPLWLDPPSADAATTMALSLLGTRPGTGQRPRLGSRAGTATTSPPARRRRPPLPTPSVRSHPPPAWTARRRLRKASSCTRTSGKRWAGWHPCSVAHREPSSAI